MKIELLENLPVADYHQMIKGNIYTVLEEEKDSVNSVWVRSQSGVKIRVEENEYNIIK